MIVIVDYDTGNTLNVKKALDYLAIDNQLSADPAVILAAAGLILPGVGAFKTAMSALTQRDLVPVIRQFAATGKPLLGICLGMQLLFDRSFEFGETAGLGLIPGTVVAFHHERDLRHRTWVEHQYDHSTRSFCSRICQPSDLFVDSYYVQTQPTYTLAITDYGQPLTSIVRRQEYSGNAISSGKKRCSRACRITAF